jgi:hypothetical protein
MCTKIILEGQKTEWRKSGARILLGDNTGGEVIRFLRAGVWISTGLPSTYIYIVYQMYNQFSHTQNLTSAASLLKSGGVCIGVQLIIHGINTLHDVKVEQLLSVHPVYFSGLFHMG